MNIVFFSSNSEIIDEWISNHNIKNPLLCYDLDEVQHEFIKQVDFVLIVDYDSVSSDFNKLISSDTIPKNTIVLEKAPEIATGKMLITHGIKAYGNSRMLSIHFFQMLETVLEAKVWTYPELTASLTKENAVSVLNDNATTLIQNRLSPKEIEVIYYILDGLTNNTIASKLDITTRTVKAHVSSIFQKLHVSDRISLVLLLK